MSPTVFREGPFRFFFFSKEELRSHVHVTCSDGEAKFWIEPKISLADSHGLNSRQLKEIQVKVEDRIDEIRSCWKQHFGRS
jgi:Domain of unknown function (DUF4160)